jgi:hypothetical protein
MTQEWGEFPSSDRVSPVGSLSYDEYKNNVSAEIIHGRFAMLGVTGAWAQENLLGTPWFMAGEECTFDKCELSYLNNDFTPSYEGALLGIIFFEVVLMGRVQWVQRVQRAPAGLKGLQIETRGSEDTSIGVQGLGFGVHRGSGFRVWGSSGFRV